MQPEAAEGHMHVVFASRGSDTQDISFDNDTSVPLIPLRNEVAFPFTTIPLALGRESSLALAQEAMESKESVILVAQKNPDIDHPTGSDLYKYGVIAKVERILDLPDGTKTALMTTGARIYRGGITLNSPYLRAKASIRADRFPATDDTEMPIILDFIDKAYEELLSQFADESLREVKFTLSQLLSNPVGRMHFMAQNSPLSVEEKVDVLSEDDFKKRATLFLALLNKSIELMHIRMDIANKTRSEITQQQREHFLQQQLQTIQEELTDGGDDDDISNLMRRASEKKWNKETAEYFEKEVRKLQRLNVQNPEYSVQYAYLDTLLNLPWNDFADEDFELKRIEELLDRDHYGLHKVKERILEHMAVIKLRKDTKAPILCLYGSPGVGKTSLGKSIAEAIGRPYARVSLGGLHDESEIRGHRKTYIGAMPGRIIAALSKAGKGNPVFVLDEIDKVGKDYKGDPSTALLEVLDPEQNNKFHDNFVDIDYDLSRVLFIATANDLSTVSAPLLDRMELVNVGGYITEEKIEIAKRHLLPKELKEHGLEDGITISDDALRYIIERYTREAGVRQLSKRIGGVLRKLAFKKASGIDYPKVVEKDMIHDFLGVELCDIDEYEGNDSIGVVTGLAWTQTGGDVLYIESTLVPGKDCHLTMTGNLGDVMKESAQIALQYLKSHADKLCIPENLLKEKDIHIHVPEGAIPKDGPSAGITMLTSMASTFLGRKVKEKIAMTGEITLRGKVLPVGGLKEKTLAAKRAGITDIILSRSNRKDIEDIEAGYLEGLTFHYVDNMAEVLSLALEQA